MLSALDAKKILEKKLPNGIINGYFTYQKQYIFIVINPNDKYEGTMDPFYAIDIENGNIKEFDIMNHVDIFNSQTRIYTI